MAKNTEQNEVVDCYNAMLDCKKCGGQPTTKTIGRLGNPRHCWICSVCGEHGKYSNNYAGAYDQWQKHNGKEL